MADQTFDFRRDYLGKEKFDMVMKRWVAQSAAQLHDDMRVQKIYPEGEVHHGGTYTATEGRGKNKKSSTVRRKRSWFEENEYRRTHDGSGNQWYSTGMSADVLDVRIINGTMQSGVIDFVTTSGAWFAELGVGLAGRRYSRGKRASGGRKRIEVDRHSIGKGKGRDRFVDKWMPRMGHTHRPSVRRQRGLLVRRLKWAAWKIHDQKLLYFFTHSCESIFNSQEFKIAQAMYTGSAKTGAQVVGRIKS